MPKSVEITIEYDADMDTKEQHDYECITTINGSYYHDCLLSIFSVLSEYDKRKGNKRLTKEAQKVLDDIRAECSEYFRGIYVEKRGKRA